MQSIPPCIEYAKINGPVDEDEMALGRLTSRSS